MRQEVSTTVEDESLTPRGSWWGVLLVLATLLGAAGGIVAIWLPVAPKPPALLETYYPLSSGVALSYRITRPDGSVSYRSESVERLQGYNALAQLDAAALGQLQALGLDLASLDVDVTLARVWETESDAGGVITHTNSLLAVQPEGVLALSIGSLAFNPPLLLLSSDFTAGQAHELDGDIDGAARYQATLVVEAQEAIDTPIGRLDDCQRVRFQLQTVGFESDTRAWYCAGAGLARQEYESSAEPGVTRYELIGVSAPGRVASVELPAPLQPNESVQARGAGAITGSISDTLDALWTFRDAGAINHVTTPPLPAGDRLLFGLQNGGLIALDRNTHTLAWKFQAGGAIFGAPAVAGGTVYAGSNDRKLYALDLASGAFRWAFATRDAISASPAVAGGLVVAGSEDRTVYALDALTGQERWRYTTGDAIAAAPAIVDDAVYIGSDDGVLYALDLASGAPRWAFVTGDAITSAPVVAGDVVYVGSHDGTLYALKAGTSRRDGEALWRYDAESAIDSDLAATPDTVYLIADRENVRAVDAHTGRERWRYHSPHALYGAPLLVGDRLIVNRENELLVLNAHTGAQSALIATSDLAASTGVSSDGREVFVGHRDGFLQVLGAAGEQPWESEALWEAGELAGQLRNSADSFATPPVLDGDRLIFVTISGGLYSIDSAGGRHERLGALADIGLVLTPPALSGDTLYVVDFEGALIAFDVRARRERWRAATGGLTSSAPSVDGGRVLLSAANDDGTTAYAFDAASGNELWRQSRDPALGGSSASVLHDGRFFFGAERLYAVDPATSDALWASEELFLPFQLVVLDDLIYSVGGAGNNWQLAAWDPATGENRLFETIDLPTFPNFLGGLAGGSGRVAVLPQDGTLLAFDAASGAEVWRQAPLDEPRGSPLVQGDTVFYLTKRNRLIARALDDGRLLGEFTIANETGTQDFSAASPVIARGRLYGAFYQYAFALELKERP